jgi:transcriptional regulator with XRE-family HTH domain
MTQRDLSLRVGMREATLSRYENNKRTRRWDALRRIAEVLETSTDYLLGKTDVKLPVRTLAATRELSPGALRFLETYDLLDVLDRIIVMERAMTLYDVNQVASEQQE